MSLPPTLADAPPRPTRPRRSIRHRRRSRRGRASPRGGVGRPRPRRGGAEPVLRVVEPPARASNTCARASTRVSSSSTSRSTPRGRRRDCAASSPSPGVAAPPLPGRSPRLVEAPALLLDDPAPPPGARPRGDGPVLRVDGGGPVRCCAVGDGDRVARRRIRPGVDPNVLPPRPARVRRRGLRAGVDREAGERGKPTSPT